MSNLLKDASILLTPTAYDNGSMNATKPSKDLYGPELVTNGDFAIDDNWSKGTGWTISGGKANGSNTTGDLYQENVVAVGKKYKVTYTISNYVSGSIRVELPNNSYDGILRSANGTYTETILSGGTLVLFDARTSFTGSIENVSVVEDLSGDFNFERNSAATRVNAQGLVENVQIISPELVSNGNFSQIGTEEVLNGDFSQEGSELVTNGSFDTDSDWTKGSGWSISGGSANCDGVNATSNLSQTITSFTGKTFLVEGNASNVSQGFAYVSLGGTDLQIVVNSSGSFKHYVSISSGNDKLFISGRNNFIGSIDNVSVKEVGQNWTLGSGWSIGEDEAISDGTINTSVSQSNVFIIGKSYKVTISVNDVVGSLDARFWMGTGGDKININSQGDYTAYWKADGTDLLVTTLSGNTATYSVTNISVKEVGQDWTVTDSDANNYVEFNQEQGTARLKFLNTSPITNLRATAQYVGGKKYKLIVDVAEVVSGGIKIDAGGVSQTYNSVGIQEAIIEPTGTSFIYFYRATSNVDITLNSVSLKEITDDTNLPRINYEGFSYQDVLGSELVLNSNFNDNSWWGLDANWSILNGAANSNGTGTIYKGGVLTVGKNYKVVVSVSSYTSGTLNYPNASKFLPSESGVYTFYYTANSQTVSFTGNSFIGSIDNVSVKEVTGQEVVPDSGCGSWLLEPQSTNLLEQSELFSDSYWSKSGASVVDGFISPEGLSNAYKLVENTATTTHQIQRSFSFLNQKYSLSAFLKADERNWIKVNLYDGSSSVYAYFDLTNGVVGQELGATGKIENYGNGWYRCSIATTLSVSAGTGNISLRLAENNGGTGYVGDGTSGAYIYGAMLEQQSYPTSYIPTSGASATRLQDIANNSGNSTLINSTEGVLYADIAALANDGTIRFLGLNDGSSNNRVVILYHSGNNNIRAILSSGSTKYVDVSSSVTSVLDFHKVAIRYSSSEFSLWIDGVKVATETSLNAPIGLDRLDFDINGSNPFYGKNKALAVYKEALTDANLRCLTYPNPVATTFDLDFDTIAEQFTFTRGSEATFVNEQGLIESTNQIGSELVTNGDFATDSDWAKNNGATISGGKGNIVGDGSSFTNLTQANVFTIGKKYKVTVDVTINSGLGLKFQDGATDSNFGTATTSGSYTFYGVANNSNFVIGRKTGGTAFDSSIDNVSVKEVISATNTPRIDYSTGAEAFLLEPQSTNLITESEALSTMQSQATITDNNLLSPTGDVNASLVVENTATNTHGIRKPSAIPTNASAADYTISVFAKKKERQFVQFQFYADSTQYNSSLFNLNDGTTTGDSSTHKIEDYGNGWYRCSFTDSITQSTGSYNFAAAYMSQSSTSYYAGDGTSGLYMFGFQTEQQSYATSYIPTSGASATRNQELCNNATPVINSEEGTLYAEVSNVSKEDVSNIALTDGTNSQRVQIYFNKYALSLMFFVRVDGVLLATHTVSSSGINYEETNKIAIKYKTNDISFWLNGTKVGTDTTGTLIPNKFTQLGFNSGGGGAFFGSTKDLKYYPKALADVQLEDLTTI